MIESNIDTYDLLKALKQFPENIQKNVMTGATRAGCKPIIDEARKNVVEDSGLTKKAIGAVKRKTKDKTQIKFSVTPRTKVFWKEQDKQGKPHYNYSGIIERGKEGNNWAKKEFGNSKTAAEPFMRPAFESQDMQSINASKEYIGKRLQKEVEKAKNGRS